MNTIQIQRGSALIEALATATATVLLKLLTSLRVNIVLAAVALVSLMCWLISDGQAGKPATWCIAWILHFALMSAIDIKKGGVR